MSAFAVAAKVVRSTHATLLCMANTRAVAQLVLGGIGAALTASGIITFAMTAPGPSSFGWFAYAPLADQPWSTTMVLQPGQVWGLALVFAGSLVVSGVAGFQLGLRRRQ